MKGKSLLLFLLIFPFLESRAQDLKMESGKPEKLFSKSDSLRGSNNRERSWWDVVFYNLKIKIDLEKKQLSGSNSLRYLVKTPYEKGPDPILQIDLQSPLILDSALQDGQRLSFKRFQNVYRIKTQSPQKTGSLQEIELFYHGRPHVAKNPPWDGGFVWSRDSAGNPWIATASQGIGASVWWPNKDYQGDEPDSQHVSITVPDTLLAISNGRLKETKKHKNRTATYKWVVKNPINNYDVALNIGKYTHFSDTYTGDSGTLTLDYYVLPNHLGKAKKQFEQVKTMLQCYEYWFGPYPWYEDGYKLAEAPFLGMEDQSNIAYGNGFKNGYRGVDLSGTGWGLKWDFIIIHESAHEWWGNNLTTEDRADMWVHESFANYAEALYTEFLFGRKAGDEYCRGVRKLVLNDKPIIGAYDVNDMGSGDMYYKGGNMLLIIREIIDNDSLFRAILKGINKTYWHQTVTGKEIQNAINIRSGINFDKVFQQYLTTKKIPRFEYYFKSGRFYYKWSNVVPGFDMPLKISFRSDHKFHFLYPEEHWKSILITKDEKKNFLIDPNFFIQIKKSKI